MPQNKSAQSGNVFIIILVAIFLFGALMFTFSRSGSQGTSNFNKQEAKIAAQEILNYARLVESGVNRIRRKGCSENEISFENAVVAGYYNPNSPIDKSCNIFDEEGGGLSWNIVNLQYGNSSSLEDWFYGVNQVRSTAGSAELETTSGDLTIVLGLIDYKICDSINELIGNPYAVESAGNLNGNYIGGKGGTNVPFQGSFDTATQQINWRNVSPVPLSGCVCDYVNNASCETNYDRFFYHVLLAR